MLRYFITAVLMAASFFAQSQTSFTPPFPFLPQSLTESFVLSTPASFTFATQQLNYETGQQEFVVPGTRHYESSLGPADLNITGWSHPNLRICLGGTPNAPQRLLHTGTGTRSIEEVYVGKHLSGNSYNSLTISNTDTIRIKRLYVPFGCELIHEGPAPLVIEEELHNNGYFRTDNDNVIFELDYVTHLPSTFENTGTAVGRVRYQTIRNRAVDSHNGLVLTGYWTDLLEDFEGAQWGSELSEYYLPWIVAFTVPYLPDSVQTAFTQYQLNDDTLNMANVVMASLANDNVQVPVRYRISGYHLTGIPVKGVRRGKMTGDVHLKSVWQPLDKMLVEGGSKKIDVWYDMAGGDNSEDALAGQTQESLAELGVSQGAIVSVYPSMAMYNYLDSTLGITASGLDITTDSIWGGSSSMTLDTAYYVGNSLQAYFDVFVVNQNSQDTTFFNGVVPVHDLQIVASINYFLPELNGGGSYLTTNADPTDSTSYGRWYHQGENIINGWAHFGMWPNSFSTYLSWDNLNTRGASGNRSWEHPQHLSLADTSGSQDWITLFDYDTVNVAPLTPYPLLSETTNPLYIPFIDDYPPTYPDKPRGGTNVSAPLARWSVPDYDTPQPFPFGHWETMTGGDLTERVVEYVGTPWINSEQAYNEQPYHRPFIDQPLIPNLPPGQSEPGQLLVKVPTSESFVYHYAPDGSLFEGNAWGECLDTASQYYIDLGFESETALCYNYVDGTTIPELVGYGSSSDADILFGDAYLDNYEDIVYSAQISCWEMISNPLMGYLDLNAVAANYFEDHPEAELLEFAWYNVSGYDYDLAANFTTTTYPEWYGNYPDYIPSTKEFWRRKYFRFGDEIISSEMDYVLNLLYDMYNSSEASNLSNLALEIAEDYADGFIDANDGPVYNYLNSGSINPNKYMPLGRYVQPGGAFWIRNATNSSDFVEILPSHGVYDHDFPMENLGQIFVGDYGPYGLLLNDIESYGIDTGGRTSASKTLFTDDATSTSVVTYAYENDSTMMPFVFFEHKFDDNALDGTHTVGEEAASVFPGVPFLYTDSAQFRAAHVIKEYAPHNHKPIHAFFPPPPINGAWVIEPLKIQATGSTFYDDLGYQPFPRIAIELYDTSGTLNTIKYLGVGDTLWMRDSEFNFPLEGLVYMTNLQGDFNGDGVVGAVDLINMLQAQGCCEGDGCSNFAIGDINNDGCVNVIDFIIFLQTYGYNVGENSGDWSAPGNFIDGGGMVIDPNEVSAIEQAFQDKLTLFTNAGIQWDPNEYTLTAYGQEMTIIDPTMTTLAKGRNKLQLPRTALAHDAVMLITTKGLSYIDIADLSNYGPVTSASYLAGDGYVAPNGTRLDLDEGSELAYVIYEHTNTFTPKVPWIQFYTDLDEIYNGPSENTSPTLGQCYYGAYSNINAPVLSLHATDNANVTVGLIDAFGAGPAIHNLHHFKDGVYADPLWDQATTRYLSGVANPSTVFPRKNISLAYITSQKSSSGYTSRGSATTQQSIRRKYIGGIRDYFDIYSETSTPADVARSDWGYFNGTFDSQLHQGVITGVDQMTLREYFRFKLHSVSPKFGLAASADSRHHFDNSFGPQYNLDANVSNTLTVGREFMPCQIGTYADWMTHIITPFFAAHTGQRAIAMINSSDAAFTSTQDAITFAANTFFTQSNLFSLPEQSYGPLVYDMDMDGYWTSTDLEILEGCFLHWTSLGDDQAKPVANPAAYYRAGTDALHTVTNVLPKYDAQKEEYQPSRLFHEYFDIDGDAPYFDEAIANWANCLNHQEFISFRTPGAMRTDTRFSTGDFKNITLPFMDSNQKIDTQWLNTATAPANSTGRYNPGQSSIPDAFKVVPAPSFFPTTFVSQ